MGYMVSACLSSLSIPLWLVLMNVCLQVGNGLMDDYHDSLGLYQYIWTLGFISDQTYSLLKLKCGLEPFVHTSEVCLKALDIMDMEIGEIDQYSVFTPTCVANASQAKMLLKKRAVGGRVSEQYDPCTMKHSKVYFNLPEVQEALHVPPGLAPSKWDVCRLKMQLTIS